jgi:hypothetical protein
MLTVVFLNQFKYATVMLLLLFCSVMQVSAQEQMLDSSMHYVSSGNTPEWEEFNNRSPVKELIIQFHAKENLTEQTIGLRQYDVKQSWQVLLNGSKLGNLVTDMNDMLIYMAVPSKALRSGVNIIHISPASEVADDILVGEVVLHQRTKNQLLQEAILHLEVLDKKTKHAIPSRITITNANGILQTVAATAQEPLAVRPGTIYSLNGKVSVGLPAGNYTIYAGRGFEYSVDSIHVNIKPGEEITSTLALTQEVPTEGWISSDTHIHSFTYSGHGDASIEERAITIAGEGIELPVITDHNIKVDMARVIKSLGVDRFCTPVNGMEFTTNLGHFNVFPVNPETPVPQHQLKDWNDLGKILDPAGTGAVILNHARDIHLGFRPFDAKRHVSIAGMDLNDWKFPATAMEVLNSGSLQTNMFCLFQDWFGMMNRGHFITPVGSSDSHDVSRYLVGQARTYIRSSRNDAGRIDIDETLKNFRAGKVAVSMGLLTQITINNKYGAGELAPPTNEVAVSVQVMGPGWTSVNRISLYANGKKIREALVQPINSPGVKWKETWVFPKFKNDVFLVAIAEGPFKYLPFWPLVKPFQPVSSKWTPSVIGSSGAVWIDSDGNGEPTSAYNYAAHAWKKSKGNIHRFIKLLNSYDEAIAVQAASILFEQGLLKKAQLQKVLHKAHANTRSGFQNFLGSLIISSSP